jgi:hypothetical protein
MKPRLYFCRIGSHSSVKEPVEVRDIDEAIRLASARQINHHLERAGSGDFAWSWWLVEAHSAPEAAAQADMLEEGTHPDQFAIESHHALIRCGVATCGAVS